MMLTGEAKRKYQREYMRRRRSNTAGGNVRPEVSDPVRPKVQHTNPMMVGYEPLR